MSLLLYERNYSLVAICIYLKSANRKRSSCARCAAFYMCKSVVFLSGAARSRTPMSPMYLHSGGRL